MKQNNTFNNKYSIQSLSDSNHYNGYYNYPYQYQLSQHQHNINNNNNNNINNSNNNNNNNNNNNHNSSTDTITNNNDNNEMLPAYIPSITNTKTGTNTPTKKSNNKKLENYLSQSHEIKKNGFTWCAACYKWLETHCYDGHILGEKHKKNMETFNLRSVLVHWQKIRTKIITPQDIIKNGLDINELCKDDNLWYAQICLSCLTEVHYSSWKQHINGNAHIQTFNKYPRQAIFKRCFKPGKLILLIYLEYYIHVYICNKYII